MGSKIALMLCAAGLVIGCQSNRSNSDSSTASAKTESQVCTVPGEGAAVAKIEPAKPAQPVAVYGGEQKLSAADTVSLETVLAHPDQYKDKYVRVTGKVGSVCAKKGCWLRVVPAEKVAGASQPLSDIFIKFKDPPAGRLIPMEAMGKTVTVEGTLKMGKMAEAAARHFKEDGGASPEEVAKIVGPQPQLVLATPVVAIEGIEKAE